MKFDDLVHVTQLKNSPQYVDGLGKYPIIGKSEVSRAREGRMDEYDPVKEYQAMVRVYTVFRSDMDSYPKRYSLQWCSLRHGCMRM